VHQSCSSAARSAPKRASGTYAPPSPLEDLHILDVLELAGSQSKAGIALAMHQSTVCRSLQLMQHQFQLEQQCAATGTTLVCSTCGWPTGNTG